MAEILPKALRHVRAGELSGDTAQSSGMDRRAAISGTLTGADALFMGETRMAPGTISANHHHGAVETAIYVVAGNPVFVYLEGGREVALRTEPGDYIYVPPFVAHREENPGKGEAVVVLARTAEESVVVNLASLADEIVR
jgi:uncharacterized RmlC-like cupin family protein